VLIEKLLVNLLENAAKYTPAGTHIRIGAAFVGASINISIEDDGPGLPSGLEEQLFEKFTRASGESALSGSGLGLSICRAIAQLHGMTIHAQNHASGGARFVLSITFQQPPDAPMESP
jgi:two-component system sensor histidine kinase KdpD